MSPAAYVSRLRSVGTDTTMGRMLSSRWARALAVPLGTLAIIAVIMVVVNAAGLPAPIYVVALGALIGVSYGLLGVCTSLIFRVSGVVNLALPATGIFAMSFMPVLVGVLHVPWWVAFASVIPVGFGVGALSEAIVIRRLTNAPRVVGVVASLGIAGVLASGAGFTQTLGIEGMPPLTAPPGLPQFSIGPLVVTPGYTGLILAAPILTAMLSLFLTQTRLGLAVRASASNPDNARLSSISPGLVSAGAWGLAGAISTITTVFFLGNIPSNPAASVLSVDTLLPGLGAAAIAAFTNLPRALAAGVVLGVVQQIMLWSPELAPYDDAALLVVLFIALLLSRRVRTRGETIGSWNAVSSWRPLPAALQRLWPVRRLGTILFAIACLWVLFVATRDDASAQTWTTTICLAVLSLTVGLITALGGELSLGQFGFALVGGGTSFAIVGLTGNFMLGVCAAAIVAGVASVLLALLSLRSRGLSLTILTLAFAVAVPSAFLVNPAIFGPAMVTPQQPVIGGVPISLGIPYFLFAAAVCAVCGYIGWNVWRGGFGRKVRGARDNEHAAEAFGVPIVATRAGVLFIAGLLAGIAGAVLIHSYPSVSAFSFPLDINIRLVLAVVMGGLGIYFGGPLGVLWVFGSAVATAATTGGPGGSSQTASLAIYGSALILVLLAPGGAAQLLRPLRDVIAVGVGRAFGVRYTLADLRGELQLEAVPARATKIDSPSASGSKPTIFQPVSRRLVAQSHESFDGPLLQCRDLSLRYGKITAVDSIDFHLEQGEVLGLIGPNGAGKTSTFELISGFVRPTTGQILFAGHDITNLRPDRRAQRGLVRSFQDAQLFPTMTVLEVIQLALERTLPTHTMASVLGVDLTVRNRRRAADEIVDYFGLTPYRGARICELSTGTRRFVELASLISMRPRLLLLDEPSSGIAQRESEALGPLLRRLREQFDLSMIVIEHDVPLVMSLSDRILVMDRGRELVEGDPATVRADPRVIDAYMGGAIETVERSDQPPMTQPRAAPAAEVLTDTPDRNKGAHSA